MLLSKFAQIFNIFGKNFSDRPLPLEEHFYWRAAWHGYTRRSLSAEQREALNIRFDPGLGNESRLDVPDDAVAVEEESRRCRADAIEPADITGGIKHEGVGQSVLRDKIVDGNNSFFLTDGEHHKIILAICIVGRPKLGGAGVARWSPGMHEVQRHLLAAKIA